MSFHTAC